MHPPQSVTSLPTLTLLSPYCYSVIHSLCPLPSHVFSSSTLASPFHWCHGKSSWAFHLRFCWFPYQISPYQVSSLASSDKDNHSTFRFLWVSALAYIFPTYIVSQTNQKRETKPTTFSSILIFWNWLIETWLKCDFKEVSLLRVPMLCTLLSTNR